MSKTLLEFEPSFKPYWENKAILHKIFITNSGIKRLRELGLAQEMVAEHLKTFMLTNRASHAWISQSYGDLSINFSLFETERPEKKERKEELKI